MQRFLCAALLAAVLGNAPSATAGVMFSENFETTSIGLVPLTFTYSGYGTTDLARVAPSAARHGSFGLYGDLSQRSDLAGHYVWQERAALAAAEDGATLFTIKSSIAFQSAAPAAGLSSNFSFSVVGTDSDDFPAVIMSVVFLNDGRVRIDAGQSVYTTYDPLVYKDFELKLDLVKESWDITVDGVHLLTSSLVDWGTSTPLIPTELIFTASATQQVNESFMLDDISVEGIRVSSVPEPGSLSLGLAGLAAGCVYLRTRRKMAADV